jgi:thiol-disulfide isomerase/thioredoxin
MKSPTILLVILLLWASAFAQEQKGIAFRPISFDDAVRQSKLENKPIFLHAFASWCHYCTGMVDSVYSDATVGDYYNRHFICIKLDMEKEGKELNKKLRVKTFPTLVYFDSTSAIMMHRVAGKRGKQECIQAGIDALDSAKNLRAFEQNYFSKKGTAKEYGTYFKMLDQAGLENQPFINAYLSDLTDDEILRFDNWRILYDQFRDSEASAFQRILLMRPEFAKRYTVDSIDNKILTVYNGDLMTRVQKLDTAGYQSMITKLQKSKLDIADKIIAYAELNRAKMKSDWKKYQELAVPFIEKFCKDDYRRLNEVAYNFYERVNDPQLVDKAIGWSEKAVSMQDNIRHNHTLASLYFKAGRKKAALDACNHTIELAKRNKVDYKQSTLLMEKIEELKE